MNLLDRFFAPFFDAAPIPDGVRNVFDGAYIADCLPYRFFDPERGMFVNDGTAGFIIEYSGAGSVDFDERLHSVLMQHAIDGVTVQFINWTSPDLSEVLGPWRERRAHRDGVKGLAQARTEFIEGRVDGMKGTYKNVPHLRRMFFAAWVDIEVYDKAWVRLRDLQESALHLMTLGGKATIMQPEGFLSFLAEIFRCGKEQGEVLAYEPMETLNVQIPGSGLSVGEMGVSFHGQNPFSAACGSVRSYPRSWSFAAGQELLGDRNRSDQRVNGPTLISLTGRMRPRMDAAGDIRARAAKLEHGKATGWGAINKTSAVKAEEIERLAMEIDGGEGMFEAVHSVVQFAPGEEKDATHDFQRIASVFRRSGFKLEADEHLQLPILLGALPFYLDKSGMADMRKAQRMRLMKGAAICALAPAHREPASSQTTGGMICFGPLGETYVFDPFTSSANYNVAVIGRSGAGKSVLMQDLAVAAYGGGAKVVVIDDGFSFEKTVDVLGGSMTAFEESRGVSVNPFSLLNAAAMADPDYRGEALGMLTSVIATMAELSDESAGRVQNIEEELIEACVEQVWNMKGRLAEISDVRDALRHRAVDEPRLIDIVPKLDRYSRGGLYGSYFEGEATLSADGDFLVFELSTIKTKPGLASVILQIVMFLASELMFRTSRDQRVVLVIDEAWGLLGDGPIARFIEGLVRRVRKYNGSLVTGTQSLSDYESNESARICKENSSWTIVMGQNPDTLERYRDRLGASDAVLAELKAITSVRGEYSEFAIQYETSWIKGRLILDPLSLAMFSTAGPVTERYRSLRKRGIAPLDALEQMLAEGMAA